MDGYTVQQISNLTGVSVRTLHHYDAIGLLQPIARTMAGYRLYSYADLLRLQQVLFYRELDIPLKEIAKLMDSPAYDRQATLSKQRDLLLAKQLHVARLIKTIDKTLQTFKNGKAMLLDEELFEGLKPEEIAAIQQEVTERWGAEQLASSRAKLRKMDKAQLDWLKAEGKAIATEMAKHMDRPVRDADVQELVARHYSWLQHFNDHDYETYTGIARLYVDDERFAKYYNDVKPGLGLYLSDAILLYAERNLK